GVDGMKDIADLPKVTAMLLEAGYSEEDIAKIWGGNLQRLMREVEAAKSSDVTSPKTLN
ncbi:MAG: dipeptidase, partial [Alphaproteobacteria bacterium]|nr:dipeptidase [Alphaproteobacteria bacterium]